MNKEVCVDNQQLPWHNDCWEQLMDYRRVQRIPHALLITGNKGLGKLLLAHQFAQLLLCEDNRLETSACGLCMSCRLFLAGTHPDLMKIGFDEDDKAINIASVRELITNLALSPQYGGYRIVLLSPADRLNRAASNSLLKTLEEPIPGTVIFLLTDTPNSVSATVLSRCQRLNILVPARNVAYQWLKAQKIESKLETLLVLARGAPLEAMKLAQEEGILEYREELFAAWLKLSQAHSDPIATAELWAESNTKRLIIWMTSWVIDMVRLHACPSVDHLYNPDLLHTLQAEAKRLNLKQLFNFLDLLFKVKSLLNTQINQQLLLENLLIQWCRYPRIE